MHAGRSDIWLTFCMISVWLAKGSYLQSTKILFIFMKKIPREMQQRKVFTGTKINIKLWQIRCQKLFHSQDLKYRFLPNNCSCTVNYFQFVVKQCWLVCSGAAGAMLVVAERGSLTSRPLQSALPHSRARHALSAATPRPSGPAACWASPCRASPPSPQSSSLSSPASPATTSSCTRANSTKLRVNVYCLGTNQEPRGASGPTFHFWQSVLQMKSTNFLVLAESKWADASWLLSGTRTKVLGDSFLNSINLWWLKTSKRKNNKKKSVNLLCMDIHCFTVVVVV